MPLLEIHDLLKTYRTPEGAEQVIVDVPSFAMEAGEHVALAGTSGSGKTTLLNLIAGILRPDRGVVRLEGRDMAAMTESQRDHLRASAIGYVFQTFNLLQGYTAIENVMLGMAFGAKADRSHAVALLKRVGLADRLNYRPAELSVGQQQRVAVARALAKRPRLVLADEPTGNLDPARAAEAMTLIRDVCHEHGAALLLVSHDRDMLGSFHTVHQLNELNRARSGEMP